MRRGSAGDYGKEKKGVSLSLSLRINPIDSRSSQSTLAPVGDSETTADESVPVPRSWRKGYFSVMSCRNVSTVMVWDQKNLVSGDGGGNGNHGGSVFDVAFCGWGEG